METEEKYLTEVQKKQIQIMNHYGEDRQLEKLEQSYLKDTVNFIMESKVDRQLERIEKGE